MKFITFIFICGFTLSTNLLSAQNKTITATVVNVTSDTGNVSFALYNKATFMKRPLKGKKAIIVNGKSTVVFKRLEKGEYAVVCYHDKNENKKMDFEPNGMPAEDYGASNNNMSYGPPKFEEAKFMLEDKNVSLDIKF